MALMAPFPDAGFFAGRNGLLYGTTSSGGASGNGEVFRLNSQNRGITVLHSFAGSDGASPEAPLTLGPGGSITDYRLWWSQQLRTVFS